MRGEIKIGRKVRKNVANKKHNGFLQNKREREIRTNESMKLPVHRRPTTAQQRDLRSRVTMVLTACAIAAALILVVWLVLPTGDYQDDSVYAEESGFDKLVDAGDRGVEEEEAASGDEMDEEVEAQLEELEEFEDELMDFQEELEIEAEELDEREKELDDREALIEEESATIEEEGDELEAIEEELEDKEDELEEREAALDQREIALENSESSSPALKTEPLGDQKKLLQEEEKIRESSSAKHH